MKNKKAELQTIKVFKSDAKKLKIWAAQRGLKIYQVATILINAK